MDENNNLFWNSDEAGEDTVDNNSLADTSYRSAEAEGDHYLFVNSYRVKEEHIKEFYFSSLRSVSFIIWCIVAVVVVIGVVLYTIFSGFDPLWTFAGVLWALYPIFRLYVCLRSISLYKMRLKESYGGELPQQVYCFLEDRVVNEENKNQMICYGDVKRVILTKNLILLRTVSKLNHIIPRDSFVKGNEKDFLDFMRGKGIKIKGK